MLCRNCGPLTNMISGPCQVCGADTVSDWKLCERCSLGLDECLSCRAVLNYNTDAKQLARFRSSEATAALAARKAAVEEYKRKRLSINLEYNLEITRARHAIRPFGQRGAEIIAPRVELYEQAIDTIEQRRQQRLAPITAEFESAVEAAEGRLARALGTNRAASTITKVLLTILILAVMYLMLLVLFTVL